MAPLATAAVLAVPSPQVVKLRYIDSITLGTRLNGLFPAGGWEVEASVAATFFYTSHRFKTNLGWYNSVRDGCSHHEVASRVITGEEESSQASVKKMSLHVLTKLSRHRRNSINWTATTRLARHGKTRRRNPATRFLLCLSNSETRW